MIRSARHGYLFVQLPHTGCSAVAQELVDHYDGQKILGKHATYREFEASGSDWKPDFVFSTVRHPLDDIVSTFEKLRTNHESYDDPARHVDAPGGFVDDKAVERFEFVQSGAGFEAYVRKYHALPFDNWASLDHERFDFVMRFEHLTDDFDRVLRMLGIEPVRSLPRRNATQRAGGTWQDYWASPELRRFIAARVAPFMRDWGYEFPPDWPSVAPPSAMLSTAVRRALLVRRARIWSRPAPVFAGD